LFFKLKPVEFIYWRCFSDNLLRLAVVVTMKITTPDSNKTSGSTSEVTDVGIGNSGLFDLRASVDWGAHSELLSIVGRAT
jgi:hypothetical protein